MIIHYYYGNVYNNRGGITEMNNRIPAGRHADPISGIHRVPNAMSHCAASWNNLNFNRTE